MNSGLPWWAAIVVATIALRSVCTLPLAIQNRLRTLRLRRVEHLLLAWERTLGAQARAGPTLTLAHKNPEADRIYKLKYREKANELYRIYRCHPFRTFLLPWVQIPLFISMSFALRWLVAYPAFWMATPPSFAPGMDEEGALWFDNLTIADPTLITPILVGATYLMNIEFNTSLRAKEGTRPTSGQIAFRFFLRSLSILIIPIAAQVPMAITLYWLTSALFSTVQNLIFYLLDRNPVILDNLSKFLARVQHSAVPPQLPKSL
eukprot:jgi/Hompol1/4510/HPOL_003664-RA